MKRILGVAGLLLVGGLSFAGQAFATEQGQMGLQIHIAGYLDDGRPSNDLKVGEVLVTSEPAGIDCSTSGGACFAVFPDGYDPSEPWDFHGLPLLEDWINLHATAPKGYYVDWSDSSLRGGWNKDGSWRTETLNGSVGGITPVVCTESLCRFPLPFNDPAAIDYWGEDYAFYRDSMGEPVAHVYVHLLKAHKAGRLDGNYRMRVRNVRNSLDSKAVGHSSLRRWRFRSLCASGTGSCQRVRLVRGLKGADASPVVLVHTKGRKWVGKVPRNGLWYGCVGTIWKGGEEKIVVEAGNAIRSDGYVLPDPLEGFGDHARGRAKSAKATYTISLSRFTRKRARTKCGKALIEKWGLKVGRSPSVQYRAEFVKAWR